MIEQITISVSSFEVQNEELRREKNDLQVLLQKAKKLPPSQGPFLFELNQTDSKENIPRNNSKIPVSTLKL